MLPMFLVNNTSISITTFSNENLTKMVIRLNCHRRITVNDWIRFLLFDFYICFSVSHCPTAIITKKSSKKISNKNAFDNSTTVASLSADRCESCYGVEPSIKR